MRIFVNALSASAGGGVTYLKNLLPHLTAAGTRTTIAIAADFRGEGAPLKDVEVLRLPFRGGAARRFWFEQQQLPEIIQRRGADVLLSTGNFALRNSPVPQILLSRNSLYTCPHFYRDLIQRGEYRMWLDTRFKAAMAKRSVAWADRTVAPSESFARELEKYTGRPITALYHGFDYQFFAADNHCPETLKQQLDCPPGVLRVLLVSHYNYYRNFETVFRGIARLQQQRGSPAVRLFLTCELNRSKTPGAYNPEPARRLIERLGIRDQVVELGAVPYEKLHHLYRACHIYVSAAYTETFAHPLVEAMSSGLPVLASDIPVHREICQNAALYFSAFSEDALSEQLSRFALSPALREELGQNGLERSRAFSWKSHVEKMLTLAEELAGHARTDRSRSQSTSAA